MATKGMGEGAPLGLAEFTDKFTDPDKRHVRADQTAAWGGGTAKRRPGQPPDWWRQYLPPGFVEVKEWRDRGLRQVYRNDAERAIITYVTGDILVETFPTEEAYRAALARMAEFYRVYP